MAAACGKAGSLDGGRVNMNPARCTTSLTCNAASALPVRGGTLARDPVDAGHFYPLHRTFRLALCSVGLSRNARSVTGAKLGRRATANRAGCTEGERGKASPQDAPALRSAAMDEAAHQLRAQHTNQDQAAAEPHVAACGAGASGLCSPARLLVSADLYQFAHGDGSYRSTLTRFEHTKRAFEHVPKRVCQVGA